MTTTTPTQELEVRRPSTRSAAEPPVAAPRTAAKTAPRAAGGAAHAARDLVSVRLMRLSAVAQGLATAVLAGLGVFVATIWLVIKGGPNVGAHLNLLGQYFIGYEVTFVGSLIGFAWAFAVGFLGGYTVAAIYNFLAGRKERRLSTRR